MKNIFMFKLDEFPKLLPILSIIFWAGAIVRLIFYYLIYGIEIINFLEFSEIFTLFLNNLIVFVGFSIVGIIIVLWVIEREKPKDNNQTKKKSKALGIFLLVILLLIILGLIYAASIILTREEIEGILITGGLGIALILLLLGINKQYKKYFGEGLSLVIKTCILLFGGMLIFIILSIKISIEQNKEIAKLQRTKITLVNDEIINTDSLNYVIGNTRNYMFIHNTLYGDNKIIPMNRIKMIEISNCRMLVSTQTIIDYTDSTSISKTEHDTICVYGSDTIHRRSSIVKPVKKIIPPSVK
jgi:hypothetical protein